MNLNIIHEDEALLVVEKPARIPSTGPGSFEEAIQKQFPAAQLVHRLDNETSGLMVAAKNEAIWEKLRTLWQTPQVVKRYTALVLGKTDLEGEITQPIAHHPKKKKKMEVGGEGGQPALTRFKTIQHFKNLSLVSIEIMTGVRHQIRAHMASIGHPVAGDKVYLREKHQIHSPQILNRHFLHLSFLKFPHPATGQPCEWRSDLPPDLKQIIE